MKKVLFSIACLGWIASVIVHTTAIGGEDLSDKYPFVMGLHAGIFVVWIPMLLFLKKDEDYKQFQQSGILKRSNPFTMFKIMFKNTPPYLKLIAIAGFIYTPINFMMPVADPSIEMNTARLFSGHWIGFYGIAVAVLYPFKKAVVL
jgi:hypothetical protein